MNSQDVINILNTIAEQIGVAVEYVMPALAKYMVAKYLTNLMRAIILFVISFIGYKTCTKVIPLFNKSNDENSDIFYGAIIIIVGLIFVLSLIFGFCELMNSTDIIPWLIAPEGSVVNYVLEMLK